MGMIRTVLARIIPSIRLTEPDVDDGECLKLTSTSPGSPQYYMYSISECGPLSFGILNY